MDATKWLETETFENALELEEERDRYLPEALRYARHFSHFSRGPNAKHLMRFYDLFPREQILFLRTEDVGDGPRAVAERLQRFLGVAPRPDLAVQLEP